MATSSFKTAQYTADRLVESAGAVVFDQTTHKICLVQHKSSGEWYIPKGRRNVSEHRCDTALREVHEETGLACRMLPITLMSRAPPAIEVEEHYPDEPREHHGVCEPFMMTIRTLHDGSVKVINWYVAVVDEADAEGVGKGEDQFRVTFFEPEDAIGTLTFQTDRDVVQRAIELYRAAI